MYKKILTIFLMLGLLASFAACAGTQQPNADAAQTGPGGEPAGAADSQSPSQGNELRHVSEFLARFGAEKGFYFFKSYHPTNKEEDSYDNLMYIDYATGKRVYLCNKGNCSHSDPSCTSYIPTSGAQGLFTYKDKLYRLSNADAINRKPVVPGLFVSDLDGSNPKSLYQLDSGMNWLRDFVIGDSILYANVMVMEQQDSADGSGLMTGSDSNSRLLRINLSTGKAEIVHNLTNQSITGAFDRYIVISEPKNGELVFSLFDTQSDTVTGTSKIQGPSAYAHGNGTIYYTINKTLHSLDLKSGASELVCSLPATPDSIEIHSGYAVFSLSEKNGTQTHFAVNLSTNAVSQINLFKSGLNYKSPIEIEAAWEDSFLVSSGYQIDKEYIDWVGVWQEYISEEHFAWIKKDDFFAGKANYRAITG